MYADTVTDSMREAIDETSRRRAIQMRYNEEHGIVPRTVRKAISDISSFIVEAEENVGGKDRSHGDTLGHGAFFSPAVDGGADGDDGASTGERLAAEFAELPKDELARVVSTMEEDMRAASEAMDFEEAARLRDAVVSLKLAAEFAELPKDELARVVSTMEEDMRAASEAMDFEEAARLRDAVVSLKALLEGTSEDEVIESLRKGARKGSVFAAGRKRAGARFKK